jgi:hypothetical protein
LALPEPEAVLLEHLGTRTGFSQFLPLRGQRRDPLAQLLDSCGPVGRIHLPKSCAKRLSIACGKRDEISAISDEPFHRWPVECFSLWKAAGESAQVLGRNLIEASKVAEVLGI